MFFWQKRKVRELSYTLQLHLSSVIRQAYERGPRDLLNVPEMKCRELRDDSFGWTIGDMEFFCFNSSETDKAVITIAGTGPFDGFSLVAKVTDMSIMDWAVFCSESATKKAHYLEFCMRNMAYT